MNRKGQTLIIFVIFIPIFILICALVVDVGLMNFEYTRYKGIVDDSIREYFEKGINETKTMLSLNDIEINEYTIKEENETLEIILETKIDSIFGKIININEYEIKIDRIGQKKNEKVIIEKKD